MDPDQKLSLKTIVQIEQKYSLIEKKFFKFLDLVYENRNFEEESQIFKFSFYFLNLLVLVELGGLILTSTQEISDKHKFDTVWQIFEYSRMDVICSSTSSFTICLYSIFVFNTTLFCLLLLICVKKIPNIAINLLKLALFVLELRQIAQRL